MPTIAQLPEATTVSAADTVPISQGGTAKSASVGTILSSAQTVITVPSQSLIGRTSLGSGGPEPVVVGEGLNLASATLVATGMDHATFPAVTSLTMGSNLVISNQGNPMLMPTALLLDLFSAGENVTITPNGTISATGGSSGLSFGSAIGALQVVSSLASQDLVAVSHSGLDRSIAYANFLNGITINQAAAAGPVADTDTMWAAQSSSTMASQTFAAVWTWIAGKMPAYMTPVIEVTSNTSLSRASHNGRILVCSQPVTLTPVINNMGSGFVCTVINATTGTVTLGSGFLTSTGASTLGSWQSAEIACVTYSGGSFAYASIAGAAATTSTTVALPGQVTGLASSSLGQTSVTLSWLAPTTGGAVASYVVQYQVSGATSWTTCSPVAGTLSYQLTGLQAGTSYNLTVQATNASGNGPVSSILAVTTTSATTTTTPSQVVSLTATATSSTAIQLTWALPSGGSAVQSYTVQYRITGTSTWTSSVTGVTGLTTAITGLQAGTSYDFTVYGVNGSGSGPVSSTVSATTSTVAHSVTSITWNLLPSGTYTRSNGSIGINANVSPGTAAIQFGFSQSATIPPTSWMAGTWVNSSLWAAYVPTPATAGTWYSWAEGTDGSLPTVSSTTFLVQ